jgi:hypothetical protein
VAGSDKVFSVTDFKEGLDVRKTPLTAPGGSLRILENAVLNQGGEIEKRLAFVPMTNMAPYTYLVGQGGTALHAFGVNTGGVGIAPGSLPVPIVTHNLAAAPEHIAELTDVEPFDDKFFVCGRGDSGTTYCWYNNVSSLKSVAVSAMAPTPAPWKSKMYRIDGKYLRFSGSTTRRRTTRRQSPSLGQVSLMWH